MSGGPTIVVKFGESVADGAFFLVELDDTMNVNVPVGKIIHRYTLKGVQYFVIHYGAGDYRTLPAEGVKSQFNPGDNVFFLMHYDHNKLQITDIKATSGNVFMQGQVIRTATDEMLFTSADEPQQLSHLPAGALAVSWFGRTALLDRDGLVVITDSAPCIANCSYDYQATSCKFIPPPMTLADGDEYPVAIVVYVEAA